MNADTATNNAALNVESPASIAGVETGQYLTFFLNGEEYGVDILRVQEIKGWDTVTPIPNTPPFIRGVINLRGTIVPIVDLRLRFGLAAIEYTKTTVVVVVRIKTEQKERTMGFIVDAVSDVYNVTPDQVRPTPDFGGVIKADFAKGLATVDDKMVILLDIDKLVNLDILGDNLVTH